MGRDAGVSRSYFLYAYPSHDDANTSAWAGVGGGHSEGQEKEGAFKMIDRYSIKVERSYSLSVTCVKV